MTNIRRSLLYMPADNKRMLDKVLGLECDVAIFDLEDAVNLGNKEKARVCLKTAMLWQQKPTKELMIRVNDIESMYFDDDIELIAQLKPDAIVLPKATERAVKLTDKKLDQVELKYGLANGKIKIIPLIETAYGIYNASNICKSSNRIIAMQFGAEDYTKDMEIERTKEGKEIFIARTLFAIACKANQMDAIDTPYTDFRDEAGLAADCEAAKQAGMTAKTCIHPNQIKLINKIFFPSKFEITNAERIVKAASMPRNKELGAFNLDGEMIDAPVLARAKKILEKAKLNNY